MIIEVTPEDIRLGVRKACQLCPIARSILRATGVDQARVITVSPGLRDWEVSLYQYNNGHSVTVLLPRIAAAFAEKFDVGGKVEPFTFDLPIEAAVAEQNAYYSR